jgi:hypothetical protein
VLRSVQPLGALGTLGQGRHRQLGPLRRAGGEAVRREESTMPR